MNRERPIRSFGKSAAFGLAALAVVVLDQFTKYMAAAYIPLHDSIPMVSGYVNLVHVRNPGAAFGILAGFGGAIRSAFFVLVSAVALAVIFWLAVTSKENNPWLMSGYALFFGGALGNLIDRLRFGEVVDFIDVHVGPYHWPAFNVADSALCVGTAAFFLYFFFKRKAA
ncbi:MAG: signal peptidase II [Desulfomonile sp.]|nr:signal peptidase II [Desulfomonile sp.]